MAGRSGRVAALLVVAIARYDSSSRLAPHPATAAKLPNLSLRGALQAYLRNAQGYLAAAKQLDPGQVPMPVFSMAYEGFFQLVQAVLEFYEVRTKDAGRNLPIQRVCSDLKMGEIEFALVSKAHMRRNGTSYVSPFPPVSRAEAQGLLGILDKYILVAHQLTGVAYS